MIEKSDNLKAKLGEHLLYQSFKLDHSKKTDRPLHCVLSAKEKNGKSEKKRKEQKIDTRERERERDRIEIKQEREGQEREEKIKIKNREN